MTGEWLMALQFALPMLTLLPSRRPEAPITANGDDVRRAMVDAGISVKEAQYRMWGKVTASTASELSRMFNHRGFNSAWLELLGPVFMECYTRRVYERTTGKPFPVTDDAQRSRLDRVELELRIMWDRITGASARREQAS